MEAVDKTLDLGETVMVPLGSSFNKSTPLWGDFRFLHWWYKLYGIHKLSGAFDTYMFKFLPYALNLNRNIVFTLNYGDFKVHLTVHLQSESKNEKLSFTSWIEGHNKTWTKFMEYQIDSSGEQFCDDDIHSGVTVLFRVHLQLIKLLIDLQGSELNVTTVPPDTIPDLLAEEISKMEFDVDSYGNFKSNLEVEKFELLLEKSIFGKIFNEDGWQVEFNEHQL